MQSPLITTQSIISITKKTLITMAYVNIPNAASSKPTVAK